MRKTPVKYLRPSECRPSECSSCCCLLRRMQLLLLLIVVE